MRRTKHRRRYHTDRVIQNRQRRAAQETPSWWWPRRLEDGRLSDRNAFFDCGRAHCLLCHWDKFMEPRRTRENRAWRREAEAEVAEWERSG